MIDAIIYVPNFPALVAYLDEHAPETLSRDADGNLVMPPNVTAFTRTPAQMRGDSLLAYCVFKDDQAEQWRGTPGVEILAEAARIEGQRDTHERVYAQLFASPEAVAKYESVWSITKRYTDEEGVEHTYEQPWFGYVQP
jgi:hypothetical protein